jgi:xanthine dehydrogenase accessory factor
MVAVRRGFTWDHTSGSFHRETEKTGDSADTAGRLDLWRHVADALASGSPCILATIVERRGSTPRGLGAQMAVFGNGSAIGTIGGGCGEGTVLRTAREMFLGAGEPRLLSIDLTGDQASETTDVCGGRLSVFLEVINLGENVHEFSPNP